MVRATSQAQNALGLLEVSLDFDSRPGKPAYDDVFAIVDDVMMREVAPDDVFGLEVANGLADLPNDLRDALGRVVALEALDLGEQGKAVEIVHDDADVLGRLEVLVHRNDVRVVHRGQNHDFAVGLGLLFGAGVLGLARGRVPASSRVFF